MCGRYALYAENEELIDAFSVVADAATPATEPRYNIAPTQEVPVVMRPTGARRAGPRRLRMARWGLVPPQWPTPDRRRTPLINARAEGIARQPLFRGLFAGSRCIVPANGFFEWRRAGTVRQPYFMSHRDGVPLAFAAIRARWQRDDFAPIASCAIITVAANEQLEPLHDRMPAILDPAAWDLWLDPDAPHEAVCGLLRPLDHELALHPVTPRMNHHAFECADAVAPTSSEAEPGQLPLPW
ncbi:MAG: SOS response-associated peptidase [Spirochaetaceae bacterium]|nr:SOS response-associated peptidase [Spirochaetaceae bacterium]